MLWQIDEIGIMKEEDYDAILDRGWNSVFAEMVSTRLKNGFKEMEFFAPMIPKLTQNVIDAGIVLPAGPAEPGRPATFCLIRILKGLPGLTLKSRLRLSLKKAQMPACTLTCPGTAS
jgi:hypothetical protein